MYQFTIYILQWKLETGRSDSAIDTLHDLSLGKQPRVKRIAKMVRNSFSSLDLALVASI